MIALVSTKSGKVRLREDLGKGGGGEGGVNIASNRLSIFPHRPRTCDTEKCNCNRVSVLTAYLCSLRRAIQVMSCQIALEIGSSVGGNLDTIHTTYDDDGDLMLAGKPCRLELVQIVDEKLVISSRKQLRE